MKILFAVSNENISNSIVKNYQKNYDDTVTFKNVFYFNAIIKEIQRDRSYDRIVIGEDLEPFANNNYDAIDKFIYERLNAISEEINDFADTRIPIILICTDRRTKSSTMISKIFNIGIYDAVIGSDRKIDNVCKLISTPRTKEEAIQYYKLDTNLDSKSLENVGEEEVKNIVSYYRKLGKNEERYTDSFNNIAAQYTDAQLRIIIRYLPINVKAVLEAECAKYQELVTYANNPETAKEKKEKERIRQEREKEKAEQEQRIREEQEQRKREEEKLRIEREKQQEEQRRQEYVPNNAVRTEQPQFQNQAQQPMQPQMQQQPNNQATQQKQPIDMNLLEGRMSRPNVQGNVIIPNAINTRNATKVLSDDEMNIENTRSIKPEKPVEQNSVSEPESPVQEKINEPTLPGFDDLEFEDIELPKTIEDMSKPVVQETKTENLENTDFSSINTINQEQAETIVQNTAEPVKRGRGRPRKTPIDEVPKPKGKRGRPRKNPLPEDINNENDIDKAFDNPENFVKPVATLPGLEVEEIKQESATMLPGFENESMSSNFNSFDAFETPEGKKPQQDIYATQKQDKPATLPGFEEDGEDEFSDIELPSNITGNEEKQNTIDDFEMSDVNTDNNGKNNNIETVSDTKPEFETENNSVIPEQPTLPGMEDELEEIVTPVQQVEQVRPIEPAPINEPEIPVQTVISEPTLPGFSESDEINESDIISSAVTTATSYRDNDVERNAGMQQLEEKRVYSTGSLDSVLTGDKKIVAFIGTSKNGTSFIVNNLASLFSSIGVKTAILDMTKNRNSYYIYTNNDENLRQLSYTAIDKLENGIAEGIKADRNLDVFTAVPGDEKDFSNAEAILTTLVKNESLILIDCDFDTPLGYFANAQEIYLVQSMDILTIQPLTAFLRELKTKGILDEEKLRVVVNKEIRVRGLTSKTIIGGMSFYNDPSMSYMTELFNKDKIKACTLPFEDSTYSKYLETLVTCNVSINGYSKSFMNSLKILGNMVYPLLSKQSYVKNGPDYTRSNFSDEMNNTLNQMRNKY